MVESLILILWGTIAAQLVILGSSFKEAMLWPVYSLAWLAGFIRGWFS